MIEQLAVWITARATGLTLGENLFIGYRPLKTTSGLAAPARCHILNATGGIPNWYLASLEQGEYTVQVVTRAAEYKDSYEDAWALYNAIYGQAGWTLPALVSGGATYELQIVDSLAYPQALGPDDKGVNWEFSCNYIFRMKRKT